MPKAKKSYSERYYSLSEVELQELIKLAQAGDDAASLRLLEVFENFLSNFYKLLFFGSYSRSSYDMRRFISLYIKDNSLRWNLMKNKLGPKGIKDVNDVVRGIYLMVQRYNTMEDVTQAVNLSFLECIKIYKPKESASGPIPFSGFIYSYFFFVLKKRVDTFLIDQLGRKTFPLLEEADLNSEEDKPGFMPPPGPGLEAYLNMDEIDENWVAGDNVEGVFAILTPQERQLLKWRYIDGEKSSEIAARIVEHPNTSRERIGRIKAKITEYLLNEANDQ